MAGNAFGGGKMYRLLICISFSSLFSLTVSEDSKVCEPTDCSDGPRYHGDKPFTCAIGRKKECDSLNIADIGQPEHPLFPVELSELNTYPLYFPSRNQSYPTLNISFRLPSDLYTLQRLKAFKVIAGSPNDDRYNQKQFCRLFDFRNVTFKDYDAQNPRVLAYPCYYGLKDGQTTYIFTVITIPDEIQVKYYTTVSVSPADEIWRSNIVIWQPNGAKELWVKVGRHQSVHEYALTVYKYDLTSGQCDPEKSQAVRTQKLTQADSDVAVFNDLQAGRYFVMVVPEKCDIDCRKTKSHCIALQEIHGVDRSFPGSHDINIIPITPSNDKITKAVLGVFCGVTLGMLLIAFLAYIYRHEKGCCRAPAGKQQPTVLLLYYPDFRLHTRVVERLADMYIQAFNCNVHLDTYELSSIQGWGMLSWLDERIKASDYITFICSTGGRLQCSNDNRRRFELQDNHPLEKYFYNAVRSVLDFKSDIKRENVSVITFSYSTVADIPHQLGKYRQFVVKERLHVEALYRYMFHVEKVSRDIICSSSVDNFLSAMKEASSWIEQNPQYLERPVQKKSKDKETVLNNFHETCVDGEWLHTCKQPSKTRSNSQPSSLNLFNECSFEIHKSSQSLSKYSLSCQHLEEQQALLNTTPRFSQSDSDEIFVTKSVSDVVVHKTPSTFNNNSQAPSESSSEESDINQTVQQLYTGPDTEKIRQIVNPCYCPSQRLTNLELQQLRPIPSKQRQSHDDTHINIETNQSHDC